ncbi:RNA-directed DNA polymerase, eukaryota [Tanacetum coccineum]|uniref:RNA-directed DNA polymerase, eukaryota n=1 Tax=Tanacetum coccineum TaxID=301880 RepID=A0ABQ5HRK8_9ASTR
MNFLDNTTSKDLWEVCKGYGTVVDVFIPDRKSKAGKRFAFVRFIKVDNVDRLVGNLCTLWIGRMHLLANVARFNRPLIHSSRPNISTIPAANGASSFASVLKGNPNNFNHIASSPAMVLDDECVVERDLDNFVMGEVKDFSSINNLRVLLSNEGFQHVRLAYLGGLWVMIELTSVQTKMRFMKHVGVASWFSQLCKAQPDFVSRERIVWIDIEGVPLHAWSRPTFSKIGSRWGEVIELEDNKEDCFARKRICIKTKLEDNILEKFKIIVRGKNFVIRAKELFVWSPTFNDNKEVDDYSEDDSVNGAEEINGDISKQMNLDDETDIEGVSDTVFDDKADSLGHEHTQNLSPNEKENSSDPFNLYNLLNKRDKGEANSGLDWTDKYSFPTWIFTWRENSNIVDAQETFNVWNYFFVNVRSEVVGMVIAWFMGDFNEVRCMEDRLGSSVQCAGVMVVGDMVDGSLSCPRMNLFAFLLQSVSSHGLPNRCKLNYTFPNRLSSDQLDMLESPISRDEVRNAVWDCGENKSPGRDGFTFEFFRKF